MDRAQHINAAADALAALDRARAAAEAILDDMRAGRAIDPAHARTMGDQLSGAGITAAFAVRNAARMSRQTASPVRA